MIEAAQEALGFVDGRTRQDLASDRMLTRALLQSVTIVGEAASRVSTDARRLAPDVPWQAVIGMRNRLVHAYFDVDFDLLWSTVADRLPALVEQLQSLLQSDRD